MIQGYPTKKGTGISIYGDYSDLLTLHQTLHKLCDSYDDSDKNPITNTILNFAYEVRKAYSGNRKTEKFSFDGITEVEYLGFDYLWTGTLVTISAARYQAGLVVTDEMDQANLYKLEYITKVALEQYDPQGASELKNYINQRIDVRNSLLEQVTQYIDMVYLNEKPTKSRFRKIPKLLSHYSEWSPEFKSLKRSLEQQSAELGIKPNELVFDSENYPEEIIW